MRMLRRECYAENAELRGFHCECHVENVMLRALSLEGCLENVIFKMPCWENGCTCHVRFNEKNL